VKQLRLSSLAKSDLGEIWLFIAEDNVSVADRFIDELFSKFLILIEQPILGRDRQDVREGVRSLVCGKLVIFYKLTEGVVDIVRVLHGARDIENIF